jgi:LysM repeat protein
LEEYDEEEPTTRFSTALVVVLFLHVVFAGGIYAFSRVKASRLPEDAPAASTAKVSSQKPALTEGAPAQQPLQAAVPPPAIAAQTTTSIAPISGNRIYHVKSGDSFSKIANANGVTASELAEFNGLKDTAPLRVGQILNIPQSKSAGAAAKATPASAKATPVETAKLDTKKTEDAAGKTASTTSAKTYTVKKGDNPVNIAKNLHVSYEELLKLNKIEDPKKLQIGAVLKLPPVKKSTPDHT